MKNKSHYLLILLLTVILSVPSLGFSEPPNPKLWEPLQHNLYYNNKFITPSSDVRLVWTYKTMTDEDRAKRIEEVKKYDLEKSIKYRSYHHEADLWEIDCKNKQIVMKEFIDFDKDGKVLDRYQYNHSEVESIVPGSGAERLYKNVCFPRKAPAKKKKYKSGH